MTDEKVDDSKNGATELLGIRLGRASEHVIWTLLSVWLFLEAIPSYDNADGRWEGPVSWFSALWLEAGLPGNPLVDAEGGVWSAFDSTWAVWLFVLLSAGTCGLALGHPEKWGLRALSYLGIAAALEAAETFWPVVASVSALGLTGMIAGIRCWWKDRDPGADDYMDYAPLEVVFIRFINDVVLHYLLPLFGPVILLLLTLQNFWVGPQPRPTEDLLLGALRRLRKSSDSPLAGKDLMSALEVFISLNGSSRQETKRLAARVSAAQNVAAGAVRSDDT